MAASHWPIRSLKAIATNQVARLAPGLYVRLTGQTGRGDSAAESSTDAARYFRQCISDYLDVVGVPQSELADFLDNKVVLEYGPGDIPGVALLLVAFGVRKVYCVDRFPLVRIASNNLRIVQQLRALLSASECARFDECFVDPDKPEMGFNPSRIEYLVRANGVSGLKRYVDLVVSRAVLEHVNDLEATFQDMHDAMRDGAIAIHQVDLRSHGLHVSNPLDFLAPPSWLWQLMHSHKGVPNRWRADHYDMIVRRLGVETIAFWPTALFSKELVAAVRPQLSPAFAQVTDEQLAWQGFWLAFRKNAAGNLI
jgi:SAM-dependent methyltransferase